MSKPIVFLDMDEVLVDFMGGIARLFTRDLASLPRHYSLVDTLGLPYPVIDTAIKNSPDFWVKLEPFPRAKELYDALRAEFAVVVLSMPWKGQIACHEQKLRWCRNHLGVSPDDVILTPYKSLLSAPGRILIDDRHDNCVQWIEKGGSAAVYPARHNCNYVINRDPTLVVETVRSLAQSATSSVSLNEKAYAGPN